MDDVFQIPVQKIQGTFAQCLNHSQTNTSESFLTEWETRILINIVSEDAGSELHRELQFYFLFPVFIIGVSNKKQNCRANTKEPFTHIVGLSTPSLGGEPGSL